MKSTRSVKCLATGQDTYRDLQVVWRWVAKLPVTLRKADGIPIAMCRRPRALCLTLLAQRRTRHFNRLTSSPNFSFPLLPESATHLHETLVLRYAPRMAWRHCRSSNFSLACLIPRLFHCRVAGIDFGNLGWVQAGSFSRSLHRFDARHSPHSGRVHHSIPREHRRCVRYLDITNMRYIAMLFRSLCHRLGYAWYVSLDIALPWASLLFSFGPYRA